MPGVDVRVGADIRASDAYSAHADRDDILRWLGQFRRRPEMTYVVHGEPPATDALREAIATELGWNVAVAEDGRRVLL